MAMANFGFGFPKAQAVFSTEELVQKGSEFLKTLGPAASNPYSYSAMRRYKVPEKL